MTITYRNGVSIAEVVVYIPALAIAIFLAVRHGFRRNSGWLFLILFCLARIIGPCMQLATISQPHNTSLFTGSSILQNIGVSPLQLATIGLLSRLLDSINRNHHTMMSTRMFKLIEVLITVGLILGIVGGIDASQDYVDNLQNGDNSPYKPGSLSKASTALLIVSYVLIVLATIITSFSVPHADQGEKRIMLAIAISLPFLLIRIIYSSMSTFSHVKAFNLLNGSVTVILCVALLEEFIVVAVYEIIGLTLHEVPKNEHVEGYAAGHQHVSSTTSTQEQPLRRDSPSDNMALKIAKKTIIGRLVMTIIPGKSSNDLEMRRH